MKLFSNKTLMVLLILVSGYGYIASCTHKEDALPPAASNTVTITRGNHIHLPGTMLVGDSTQWKLDKVHSSVLWSGSYIGAAGLLTGRFNQFGMHDVTAAKMIYYSPAVGQPLKDTSWAFYENDPSKTYINGYVQMNTSNTGEPGRDTGCNIGTLGTIKIINGTYNLSDSNLAKIKSTKVEFDPLSNDYYITFDLTWRGKLATPITKSIVGKLKYIPQARITTYSVFGLQLKFQLIKTDFGIVSTSISDKVDIECNMNFNNK